MKYLAKFPSPNSIAKYSLGTFLLLGSFSHTGAWAGEVTEFETKPPLEQVSQPIFVKKLSDAVSNAFDKAANGLNQFLLNYKYSAAILQSKSFWSGSLAGYGQYQRLLTPAYLKESAYLVDSYGLNLTLGKSGSSGEINYSVGPNELIQIAFARLYDRPTLGAHFKTFFEKIYLPFSNCDKAKNYIGKVFECRLPLNSKMLQEMKRGDIVFVKRRLGLLVAGNRLFNPSNVTRAILSAQYLVSGEFNIQIVKKSEKEVRMILIGDRSEQAGLSAGMDLHFDDLQISNVQILQKAGKRIIEFRPIDVSLSKIIDANAFMVDYIFDPANTKVAAAYDKFMSGFYEPVEWELLVNRDTNKSHLALVKKIEDFEAIFDIEKKKEKSLRALDRVYNGELKQTSDIFSFSLGSNVFGRLFYGNNFADLKIRTFSESNEPSYFRMPILNLYNRTSALVGGFKTELDRRALMLFRTNEKYEIPIDAKGTPEEDTGLHEIAFSMDRRDNNLDASELESFRQFIHLRVPEDFYQKIDWKNWAIGKSRKSARFTSLLVFRDTALALLNSYNPVDIFEKMKAYVSANFKTIRTRIPIDEIYTDAQNTEDASQFDREVSKLSEALIISLNLSGRVKPEKQIDTFVSTRTSQLWEEISVGFLSKLVRDKAEELSRSRQQKVYMEELYYFEANLSARGEDPLNIRFGTCNNRTLYNSVINLYDSINRRDLDLQLLNLAPAPLVPSSRLQDCPSLSLQ